MSRATGTSPHLSDAELVQWLDGELAAESRASLEPHLSACEQCDAALDALRQQSGVVRAWLERAAFEDGPSRPEDLGPPRPGTRPGAPRRSLPDDQTTARRLPAWLKAAAAVALLAAPLAAIPGVRDWVLDRVRPGTGAEMPAVEAARDHPATVVRFTPEPGHFLVEVDGAQAGGELRVGRSEGAEAVFTSDAGASVEPVVSAGRLRLRNEPSATADYTLRVPASVTSLGVRVGGRIVEVSGARLEAGTSIPLTP